MFANKNKNKEIQKSETQQKKNKKTTKNVLDDSVRKGSEEYS